jgi:predicted transport protein
MYWSSLIYFFAFKRIKNFASIEVHPLTNKIVVFVKGDLDTMKFEEEFTRDVRKIGHYGTGDLEITIGSDEDLERAKPLIIQSYENN